MYARVESYSYMPDSNMPTTSKDFIFGIVPIGPNVPSGETTVILLPTNAKSLLANSFPIIIPCFSFRASSLPSLMFFFMSVTFPSSDGSMPRRTTPDTPLSVVSIT